MKHLFTAFAAAALVATLAPREAHAQFRANASLGIEHLRRGGDGITLGQLRVEAMFEPTKAGAVGLYVQHLERLDGGGSGWGMGVQGMGRLLPSAPLAPIVYGSLGYQRAPSNTFYQEGFFGEVGGGVSYRAAPILDLELRAGFVGLLGRGEGLTGFSTGLVVSLHPG